MDFDQLFREPRQIELAPYLHWLQAFTGGWFSKVLKILSVALALSVAAYLLVARLESWLVRRGRWPRNFSFIRAFFLSAELFLLGIVMVFLPSTVRIPAELLGFFQGLARGILILAAALFTMKVVDVLLALYLLKVRVDHPDNLRERKLRTQVLYLERVVDAVILVIAVGLFLLGFDRFRRIGGSLVASAGLASLIVGFAAQRSLGNLIAGLQIAFTQPIRLGDAVLVENEWGEIEEITLTYVVVRLWDLRRMVLPINYFLEKPFQNWTRTSAELIGSVVLFLDYSVPVDVLRQELTRLLQASPRWDGKENLLQVVDSSEKTMVLRALVSARNAGALWELRCEVREKLISFLRDKMPNSFPKERWDSAFFPPLPGRPPQQAH